MTKRARVRQRGRKPRLTAPTPKSKSCVAPPGAERGKCPQCGGPVWIRKPPPLEDPLVLWRDLRPEHPMVVAERMKQREGKKTVVLIGTSPISCGLTPWDEPGLTEFWSVNDAHHLPFMRMDKISRWFQLHHRWRFERPQPRYQIDHWKWLQQEHPFPIYMQRRYLGVPSSVKFPLREITEAALCKKLGRGAGWQRKYYTCSFAYCVALALYEGFERIEIYGVELQQEIEYVMQRPSTEFWVGLAIGRGVEVYVPGPTHILQGVMYGYRWPDVARGRAEDPEKVPSTAYDEDNVGIWDEYPDGMFRSMLEDLGEVNLEATPNGKAPKSGGVAEEAR